MRKSTIRILTVCAVGALGLTACGDDGGGGDGGGGTTTIKLVAADYGDKASNASKVYWDDVVKRF
ncbi:sugar ABC transporter substrate-binding protein, partial [Streptomyces sp. NPDC004134]